MYGGSNPPPTSKNQSQAGAGFFVFRAVEKDLGPDPRSLLKNVRMRTLCIRKWAKKGMNDLVYASEN